MVGDFKGWTMVVGEVKVSKLLSKVTKYCTF